MSLIGFHKFLISTAILFCAAFGAWQISVYASQGGWPNLLLGIAFLAATPALVYYLVNLERFLDRKRSR